jgi:hypothetical protein
MADSSRRRSTVKAAIENILHRLSALPPSAEVETLRGRAVAYLGETDGWTPSQPTVEETEQLMRRVLKLHVELAKLERQRQ